MTTRHEDGATRRGILRTGLTAVGGAVLAGTVALRARAQEKIAQAMVQYQKTPKDGHQCSTCVNFEAPASCKIVAGTIDPAGWCIAYAPKES